MYIGCRNCNLNTVTTQQLALFCVVFSTLTSIQVNQQPVTDYLRTSGISLSLSLSVYSVLSIAPDLSIWIKYLFNVPFGLREREGEQSRVEQSRVDLAQNQLIFSQLYSTLLHSSSFLLPSKHAIKEVFLTLFSLQRTLLHSQ